MSDGHGNSHAGSAAGPPQLSEISDGIFAYLQPDGSWYLNNTGFLVGRRGVVSVDATSTERRTRAYLAAMSKVSSQPVRTLINTHHHGDHTFGNFLFESATIVAHEATRDSVLATGLPRNAGIFSDVEWGDVVLEPPFLTYADRVTLFVDELRCEVAYVGTPAHTTNDSIVWIPERSVLFCGDLLFNGGTPFLLMGSIEGAIEVLETIVRPLGASIIVPGHGPLCGPELIDDVLEYLRFVMACAEDGRRNGLSPLECGREVHLGRFAGLTDPERIVGNLHRAYVELETGRRDAEVDIATALADMVAYNGGRPLTCLA